MLLADLLEQEKQEQQQQQPLPTGTPTSTPTNLPPGAQPIPSLQQQQEQQPVPTDPSMVTMNPSMVTGQIVPNQQVGGMRPQLQTIQPQRPPGGATTVQAFVPRNAPPGAFPGAAQVPPSQQQRMVNPTLRQAGPTQQSWPQRHPQEVTLQQRGPGNSPVPQGSMIPMQIPTQQQTQIPGALAPAPQLGAPQQSQTGVVAGPGMVSAVGASTPPPPLSNTPAPPTPPENPQTDEDRLKVS